MRRPGFPWGLAPRAPGLAAALLAGVCWLGAVGLVAQQFDAIELTHPAVDYGTPARDPVALLNDRLESGAVVLGFDERTGYLRSLLQALEIPIESQLALFSRTSLQSSLISPRNPRTLFFNDAVAVAWMPGGFIEVAAQDPRLGAVFYLLSQTRSSTPRLQRDSRCLQCHYAVATLGVPGFLVRSIPSGTDGDILPWLGNYTTDHRSPLEERWAGWYVTGHAGAARHLGNAPVVDRTVSDVVVRDENLNLSTLAGRFDTRAYLAPYSDIVALLVFDHQMRMMNLVTRLGWEARILEREGRGPAAVAASLGGLVTELVDYLLFVDEAPIANVEGTSEFARIFSARGPRDSRGRSLRDLDLDHRLFRYPCSYLIYSDAFSALPASARDAVYTRLWQVLSGAETGSRYERLSTADRQAIVEILRETKSDLPAIFSPLPSRP